MPFPRFQPRLFGVSIPAQDPDDPRYIVPVGQEYTGVVLLELMDDDVCTGSLLTSGRHILTAAHCFERNEEGTSDYTQNPDPEAVTVVFQLPEADVAMDVERIIMHPGWRNDEGSNHDLAILELVEIAPDEAERYELYRGENEVGQVFTRIGFGTRSTGAEGEDDTEEESVMRVGQNRYEALGEIFNGVYESDIDGNDTGDINTHEEVIPGTQLVYDFDSGDPQNDALGQEFDLPDLGLGAQETAASGGDSGGPAFLNGKIAGVSSSGMSPEDETIDVTDENDTSFGEYFFDMRVSAYVNFIEQTVAGRTDREVEIASIPPDSSRETTWLIGLLVSFILVASVIWLRRR